MKPQCQPTTVTVPLTNSFHQTAQQFYQHHENAQKAKQVYLNSLSVQAVRFYLSCLGIETDLEQSESWNPILQVLGDVADLYVADLGRLECRPVLPGQTDWPVPAEVGEDRIGYVFVQLDEALTEATLLGFLPHLSGSSVTVAQLQATDDLPGYLAQLAPVTTTLAPQQTTLQQWLNEIIDSSWRSLEQILADWQSPAPALSFRTSLARQEAIDSVNRGVKQGKFLTLDPVTQVLFLVGIAPAEDTATFDITVALYPVGQQAYLPSALHLMVLDAAQKPVLQAEGRQSEGLEFQFSAEPGENFSVQVSRNQLTLTELFEI